MAKWVVCKNCGHRYMNSINRCPKCFKRTPLTARVLLTIMPIILVVLAAIILPIIALHGQRPRPTTGGNAVPTVTTTRSQETATTVSSSAVTTTLTDTTTNIRSTTTKTTKYRQPTDTDKNVTIGTDGIATITLPKWLLLLTEPDFNYQLTEKEKNEYRFIGIRKNADGSATYTIDQNDFHRCRLILSSNANALVSGLKQLNTVNDVKFTHGQYNKLKVYTTHTTAAQVQGDNTLAQKIIAAGLQATVVQYFDIDQSVGCVFEIYDSDNALLATSTFPDILL